MAVKKTYTTFVIEREIAAPRQVVWDALVHLQPEEWAGNHPARIITVEPPWRRVYELEGAPVALFQGTVALRDDGPSCHLVWAALVDPLPGGASEAFIEAARTTLTNAVDRLAEGARAAESAGG